MTRRWQGVIRCVTDYDAVEPGCSYPHQSPPPMPTERFGGTNSGCAACGTSRDVDSSEAQRLGLGAETVSVRVGEHVDPMDAVDKAALAASIARQARVAGVLMLRVITWSPGAKCGAGASDPGW